MRTRPLSQRLALPRLGVLLLACCTGPALASQEGDPSFKLSLGRYASSDDNTAVDVNLRAGRGPHTAWLGDYRDRSGYRQARSGYEYRVDDEQLRTVFSIQSASGGVAVGSVTSEIGGDSYAIVGFGRTNVRNYVNLNYDPNDAITLGLGTRAVAGTELSLFNVHDDRLHTGQNVTHAVLRQHFGGNRRLTLDVFVKRGLTSDGEMVRNARSVSIGYDHDTLFVRYAHDPYAGFNAPTQRRLTVGARY